MKWRTLVLVAAVGAIMMAILPALANHVPALRVNGNSTCASVGSTGSFSFKIAPVVPGEYTDPGPGGATIEIFFDEKDPQPNTFSFSIDGGVVQDAIVKGSAANHYDYAANGGPVTSDYYLTIPNGNSVKHVIFCYDHVLAEAQPMPCGTTATTSDGETSASFTREFTDGCEGVDKSAVLDIQGETVVFIPEGVGSANYTGDLTFTKQFDDPQLLVLLYDPEDSGAFRPVPACEDVFFSEGGTTATIPNGDTWCFYHVDAEPAEEDVEISALAAGDWEVNWSVFGMGDPRFK